MPAFELVKKFEPVAPAEELVKKSSLALAGKGCRSLHPSQGRGLWNPFSLARLREREGPATGGKVRAAQAERARGPVVQA